MLSEAKHLTAGPEAMERPLAPLEMTASVGSLQLAS
jgi:hypothetical protein